MKTILAVDLMNMLARYFHAGEPSRIHAVRGTAVAIGYIIDSLRPDAIMLAAEGGHAYRRSIWPEYKQNRPPAPEGLPEQIQLAHAAFRAMGWPVVSVEGHEADDVLATVAKQCSIRGLNCIVASGDKDLRQLIGRVGVRVFDPQSRRYIERADVERRYGIGPELLGDALALIGDPTEAPGVPLVGPKKAGELLRTFGSLDGILAASAERKTGCGKVWESIYQHRERAEMSRHLVALVEDLTLPDGWLNGSVAEPQRGWHQRWIEMGLGGPAGRLAGCLMGTNSPAAF